MKIKIGEVLKLNNFYPTALKGCRGIVFTHGGRRSAGKSLSRLYLRNRKVQEVDTW